MTLNPDYLGEQMLIEISRLQRSVLERWIQVLITAGEFDQAEQLRSEINQEPELERAA